MLAVVPPYNNKHQRGIFGSFCDIFFDFRGIFRVLWCFSLTFRVFFGFCGISRIFWCFCLLLCYFSTFVVFFELCGVFFDSWGIF